MLRSILLSGFIALLAQAAVVGPLAAQDKEKPKPVDLKFDGEIKDDDGLDPVRNFPSKIHTVKLQKGRTYEIRMSSKNFDTYLRVEDAAGKQLAEDDDGAGEGTTNSLIKLKPGEDGDYKIVATTFGGDMFGKYTLTVKDADAGKDVAKDPAKEAKDLKLATPTVKKATELKGKITDDDPADADKGNPAKVHAIELKKGTPYLFDLRSEDFDAYLRLLDADGKQVAADDDSGGDLNARFAFVPTDDGVFKVVATSFGGGEGAYALTVREAAKVDAKKTFDAAEPITIVGKLVPKDEADAQTNNPSHVHLVKLKAGKTYVIDMTGGPRTDPFLRVENSDKKQLAENDDVEMDNLNSQIEFEPEADGVYRVITTLFQGNTAGYVLTIREKK